MDYKMIAIDLDDSLLGKDLTISDENRMAIFKAVEKGVIVTIATGRMYRATLPYVEQLKLDFPVITYQGALIKNALSHETIFHLPLPADDAKRIIRECKKENLHLHLYMDDKYYMEEENRYSELYRQISGCAGILVESLEDYPLVDPTKIIVFDHPERVLKLKEKYQELLGDSVQVTISKPDFLEFTHKNATKGKAVEYLAGKFGIKREEVIAVGDSYNDISMMEYAGLGVAMGNAPDAVKQFADYITLTNDEEGVAEVIKEFILKGEG